MLCFWACTGNSHLFLGILSICSRPAGLTMVLLGSWQLLVSTLVSRASSDCISCTSWSAAIFNEAQHCSFACVLRTAMQQPGEAVRSCFVLTFPMRIFWQISQGWGTLALCSQSTWPLKQPRHRDEETAENFFGKLLWYLPDIINHTFLHFDCPGKVKLAFYMQNEAVRVYKESSPCVSVVII